MLPRGLTAADRSPLAPLNFLRDAVGIEMTIDARTFFHRFVRRLAAVASRRRSSFSTAARIN
jgi:hypothetical protein